MDSLQIRVRGHRVASRKSSVSAGTFEGTEEGKGSGSVLETVSTGTGVRWVELAAGPGEASKSVGSTCRGRAWPYRPEVPKAGSWFSNLLLNPEGHHKESVTSGKPPKFPKSVFSAPSEQVPGYFPDDLTLPPRE